MSTRVVVTRRTATRFTPCENVRDSVVMTAVPPFALAKAARKNNVINSVS